jgi:hypothetical protein
MAEAFKLLLNASVVRALGHHLQRAWPRFPRERFEAEALAGLDALELKARAVHIAAALQRALPKSFAQAARVMEAALAPVDDPSSETLPRSGHAGLAGWAVWPMTVVVMQQGLAHPERALQALHTMTQRFTAEWALRTAPLLEAPQDDPSAYVRRSVANHLNDIGKDHPALLVTWLQRHLPAAPAPALQRPTRACHSPASKPTVLRPSGQSTTGRLITLGCSRIRRAADASSVTAAFVPSSSLRQVVPWRLSSVCQPMASSQRGSRVSGTPAFLKSWKRWATPCSSSQARAFLTVSQLGMP